MNVKNRACIRRLSFKTLWTARKRNLIAVAAIALTALLFTSLFTIALSINESQQDYTFRQVGGYCHGTFKDLSEDQLAAISAHKNVKAGGVRRTAGFVTDGDFAKTPGEVSFMDKNCTLWSYAQPTEGRMPQSGKEITMDTAALSLLGVEPQLGAAVELTWTVGDQGKTLGEKTDTFTLVGWWDYDQISPVHYFNVSEDYIRSIEEEFLPAGERFRIDLNVMMRSTLDIRSQMEEVDRDLGYTWEDSGGPNTARIGVNWGYATARLAEDLDMQTILAVAAFLALVVLTGYLIIYNIFQISVAGDIRFYGLLKTIGVTPRQLRRVIRWQAWTLCAVGIPLGLLLGYGVGALLFPVVMGTLELYDGSAVSTSPLIFLFAALFALGTVQLSCARPGRLAAAVSPVEATRYTEQSPGKKKTKRAQGAKVHQMAWANLGRNRLKTSLVVVSLALSVVLLNVLTMFVGGFDMEKYLDRSTCADFVVGTTGYFRQGADPEALSPAVIQEIQDNTRQTLSGSGYTLADFQPRAWMEKDHWRASAQSIVPQDAMEGYLAQLPQRDGLVGEQALLEGLDSALFEKVQVVEGELAPMLQPDDQGEHPAIALALHADDYGNVGDRSGYPAVGDTITLTYFDDGYVIDSRTGEKADEDTPQEYLDFFLAESHDVTYTVCAHVVVPHAMSYRYGSIGYSLVLPAETMAADSGQALSSLFYLFDTPDGEAEAAAEDYLAQRTADDPQLMFESKAVVREEFESFRSMFLLLGGVLCAVIGVVGVLNFFNAIMTGILSRRREFAVLQAVGMTGRQLKAMLVYEGLFYALSAAGLALVLSLVMDPLVGKTMETVFWFFTARITLLPVLATVPIFLLLGWALPALMYRQTVKQSVVQRLREDG